MNIEKRKHDLEQVTHFTLGVQHGAFALAWVH